MDINSIKRDPRDWDIAFMEMAYSISFLSKDTSSKIGAIAVSTCKTKIASGFNGFPMGFPDYEKWWNNRDPNTELFTKYDLVDHAERNLIDYCNEDMTDWTMYVTIKPCYKCMLAIFKAGIKKVFYSNKLKTVMDLEDKKGDFIAGVGNIELELIDKSELFKFAKEL